MNLAEWHAHNPVAVPMPWPGLWPNLTERPLLYVVVTLPHDQALLHRDLAAIGYVADLLGSDPLADYWCVHHPDGVRPWLPF